MDFNEAKDIYRNSVNDSVKFVGKDHDFFTRAKAETLVRTIAKRMPGLAKPRVLDVGCGHGFIHRYLLDAGYEVAGVDVAAEVLELAKQANSAVRYSGYDGRSLPFADKSFDLAIAVCVMHHVPPAQWQAFVAEMHRVVEPGGLVIIFEHNPYNPMTRYVVNNSALDEGAVLLSSGTLRNLMASEGFQKVDVENLLFTPFAAAPFRWLDRKLWWCPLGAQYMIAGRC